MSLRPLDDFRNRALDIEKTLGQNQRLLSIYRRTIDSIDPAEIANFQRRHAGALTAVDLAPAQCLPVEKYGDIPFWIANKLALTTTLNLDKRKSLDILDLGTGAAHFPAICRGLGHRVIGLDVANPFYEDACRVFGVDRRTMGVYGRRPIPNLGTRFDVVTAIAINFHFEPGRGYWSLDDWSFLIEDLVANHLKNPGTIYFELNKRNYPDGARFDEDVLRWAVEIGGMVHWERGAITLSFPSSRLGSSPTTAAASNMTSASHSAALP